MGLTRQIRSYVDVVFRSVGDLASDVVLTKKKDARFDFSTGDVRAGRDETVSVRGIVTDTRSSQSEGKTVSVNLMLKTAEVGDLSIYDSVSVDGTQWRLGPVKSFDKFVTNVELYR